MKIRVSLIGGSGFIGGEVLRLLLGHPQVELVSVTANESAGRRVDEIQPNLRGFTDLAFARHEQAKEADATLLSLPHGETARYVPAKGRVLDLSGDHRIGHPGWTAGIPELHRDAIARATRVACAGCFATAAILSIVPLSSRGLVAGRVIVDGKTGSSGSGAKPKDSTLHAFRATSLFGYGMFSHRHQPEIEQAAGVPVLFQPHSTPLVRGVFTTSYVSLKEEAHSAALLELYRETYSAAPFVRLQEGSPNVNWTKGSNFVDIGVQAQDGTVVVFAALDNLVKGGAGQALQCMNLMFGFEETAGLNLAPANP